MKKLSKGNVIEKCSPQIFQQRDRAENGGALSGVERQLCERNWYCLQDNQDKTQVDNQI